MARHDLGRLTPADAAVALRSFGRRYRDAVRPDELAGTGPDPGVVPPGATRAPLDVLGLTVAVLRQRHRAITRILAEPSGTLDAADVPGGSAPLDAPRPASLVAGLDDLATTVEALADLAVRTPLPRWEREAPAAGVPVRAADVLRDAVAVGRAGLDEFAAVLLLARAAAD